MKSSLRIIAKKKRALITLNIKSQNTFLKHINYCLDKVLSIDSSVKIVGLYYPILNEISPLRFIRYLHKFHSKGGFKSEDTVKLLCLQLKYPKSLS